MKRKFLTAPLCSVTAGLFCIALSVTGVQANPKVYDRAMKSIGWVITPGEKSTAMGTCWVADQEKKLVITSHHLVGEAKEVLVYFPHYAAGKLVVESRFYLKKQTAINGAVVATDPKSDLALIQLDSLPPGIEALSLAAQSSRPGDDVHSVGNSGLAKSTATLWRYPRGNVRQVYERKLDTPDGVRAIHLVETQSPVNQGDSGGALLNDDAEVVGVAAAFDPTERLVSHNIDVAEVRIFLKSALAGLDKATVRRHEAGGSPGAHVLVGTWKVSAKSPEGTESHGEAEFRKDGTYVLADVDDADDAVHGRYAYANGILLLLNEDRPVSFKLTWGNKDRFSGTVKGVELSFDR